MIVATISKCISDESGATLVEYGIAIVLAVVVGTTGLIALGNQVNSNMTEASDEMATRTTP